MSYLPPRVRRSVGGALLPAVAGSLGLAWLVASCAPGIASSVAQGSGGAGSTSASAGGGTARGGGPASGGTAGAPNPGGAAGLAGAGAGGVQQGAGGAFVPGGAQNVAGTCGAIVADPTQYPACPTCTGGRCVPTSQFPGAPVQLLDTCDPNTICMPDQFVAENPDVLLKPCSSLAGAEGRCTSLCIPTARNLAPFLPQDVCNADERCAPCYNPNDGSDIGLCHVGCDPGPTAPPVVFSQCCSGRGRCVPKDAVPDPPRSSLGPESCTDSNDLCVPAKIIEDPNYRFPSCVTTIAVYSNLAGVCAPDCIVNQNSLGAFLNQGNCADPGDKCVPCNDPTHNNAPTGACVQGP